MFTQEEPMQSKLSPIAATKLHRRQPLEVANHPDAQLMLETVIALTGRSSSTLYRMMAAGQFVQPIRHGKRCTRWRAGDVTAWLRAQATSAKA